MITASQAAKKWDVTSQRVRVWVAEGRIPGAFRLGSIWVLPDGARRPKSLSGPNGGRPPIRA
jgi:hypothetical protein